ncbi:hypothetical protein IFM89_004205 [Coptis chinensis]|uniref:Uncharacterized protein n=1 Tax=Coptis chinensis TaxID=261450 RepID=A0A835I740_9MAGN|nr:hypothetical protein IFM89_004205 [Coptis chinensis]
MEMSYEKSIRALSGHFEGRAMSYKKTIRALSLHFEGTAKSYEKTIRALSLHFEGTAKSYEKTIRELSMHFEGRYVVSTPYLCNTEDLLAVHSEIVRAGEAGSDVDVSEDMHCDESASGVQEGSNDMSSEFDPFLAPTYESEDSADDIEVNEQGERINVINEPVNVPSPVNVRLLDENMPLTTTLPASRGENVERGIASDRPQVEPEIRNVILRVRLTILSPQCMQNVICKTCVKGVFTLHSWALAVFAFCSTEALPTSMDTEGALERGEGDVQVKKRSETIEQAAPISVDEAAGSTGCHPQSPPPVVTIVESTGDCGMDVGPVKKKPDMDKQREILAIKAGLPNKTCLRRRSGHSSLDVTPGATLPLVSTQMRSLGS